MDNLVESLKHLRDTRVHQFDLSEIYHYSSRFAALPQIHHQANPDPEFTSQSLHEFRIELPDQGIRAAAAAPLLSEAITEAANSFIAQTQNRCTATSFESAIDDAVPLTVKNASTFLRFYLSKHGKSSEIDARCTQKRFNSTNVHYGTLYIDGQPVTDPIMADSDKVAWTLARLAGAVHLISKEPSLWTEFVQETTGGETHLANSVSTTMTPEALAAIQTCLEHLQKTCSVDKSAIKEQPSKAIESLSPGALTTWKHTANPIDPGLLLVNHHTPEEARNLRNALPARRHAKQILDSIKENAVSVIIGSTGSGKSSQIPQMVLEDDPNANIMITLPRKLTATAIARRVAYERGEEMGQSIGYRLRWKAMNRSSRCGITYSTTGILVEDLLRAEDSVLDTLSHIFVDETHERDIPIDFLLALLKRAVKRRANSSKPFPKIIIMSADAESRLVEKYMGAVSENGESIPVPRIVIPDSAQSAHRYFLEDVLLTLFSAHPAEDMVPLISDLSTAQHISAEKDLIALNFPEGNDDTKSVISDTLLEPIAREPPLLEKDHFVPLGLIAATVAHIAKNEGDGVILVLLPGLDVMKRLEQMLYDRPLGVDFTDEDKFELFRLHSGLGEVNSETLRKAKEGRRKIILSTNIAENGVNIPEVRYVVDSGKKHDTAYDPTTSLRDITSGWIDKSDLYQRQGCAGQTGDGFYYAMFTKARCDTLESAVPGVTLARFETECLQLAATIPELPVQNFLRELPEPPSQDRIDGTISNLKSLGAFDDSGNITALGRILSVLPISPMAGKIVILGILLRCLEPALILGAAIDSRPLFIPSRSERACNSPRRNFAGKSNSDYIATMRAYQDIRIISSKDGQDAAQEFCLNNAMSYPTYLGLEECVESMVSTLRHFNLISESQADGPLNGGPLNENSGNLSLLRALISGAVAPNLAGKPSDGGKGWQTSRIPKAVLSNKSTNSLLKSWAGRMVAYGEAVRFHVDADVILMDTTSLHPLTACLFGEELAREDNTLLVNSFFPIKVKSPIGLFESDAKAAGTVVETKRLLDKAFTAFYEKRANNSMSEADELEYQSLAAQIANMTTTFSDGRRPSRPLIRRIR
ncbi:helicase domain-containing protein [Arthroderma uncinatum]|uniref:helicase domain-containing protein n=1 Tax=Arthroderma uncinatum TaxID=74035 RepID=UPI00144ACBE3|nr:helicase domain-containing protein [Arthroderma uncinatum]KAF3480743.1 helicase domain-containing protein [Arthroderma uncinatum]